MGNRLVMGYWDCPYCGQKKIQGTIRECPNCSNPRGSETKFYMDTNNIEYLSPEQAKNKGKGADWLCPYCDKLNPIGESYCLGCGAAKEESTNDYFSMQKKPSKPKDTMPNREQNTTETPADPDQNNDHTYNQTAPVENVDKPTKSEDVDKSIKKVFSNMHFWKTVGIVSLMLALCLGLIELLVPREKTFHCTGVSWENVINVEAYETVEESDWYVPSGGRLQYTREEIRSYVSVLDHYETVTKTRTVVTGSHTEYTYQDNGDGTFTEIPHEVTDYGEETYTEQEPVYRQDPVYDTKYYYEIEKWIPKRKVKTAGNDHSPYWGDVELADNEREGSRGSDYYVSGWYKEGKNKNLKVSEDKWKQMEPGKSYRVKTNSTNAILEIIKEE